MPKLGQLTCDEKYIVIEGASYRGSVYTSTGAFELTNKKDSVLADRRRHKEGF